MTEPDRGIDVDRIYDKTEAGKRLNLCPRTLDRLHARGDGPRKSRLSARRVGYLGRDLVDWLASRPVA